MTLALEEHLILLKGGSFGLDFVKKYYKAFYVSCIPPKYENIGKFSIGKFGVIPKLVPLHSTKVCLPRLVSAQGSLQCPMCMTQQCLLCQTNTLPGPSTLLLISVCFTHRNKYCGQMFASLNITDAYKN